MNTNSLRRFIGVLILAAFCNTAADAWARLPKPLQATAVVLVVDADSRTLVVKFAKAEKPVLLDWDDKTEFAHGGQPITPSAVNVGATVTVIFKNVSFHNPLLKRVSIPEHAKST